jgi:D-sedoheptulose 7-phosphate isomerase
VDSRLSATAVDEHVTGAVEAIQRTFAAQREHILRAARLIADCYSAGGKVLLCGNGGSAADAQHFAGEMVGRFLKDRRGLPALSLAANPSVVTALGNDIGYENVFSRQVEALGRRGDVLVCISTSGTSANILRAARTAHDADMKVVALTGRRADALAPLADVAVAVPADSTPHVQEAHAVVIHVVCRLVEQSLFV